MQHALETTLDNIDIVAKLGQFPTHKLRVVDNYTLSHDDRNVLWFARKWTGDGKERVMTVLDDTVKSVQFLFDMYRDLNDDTVSSHVFKQAVTRILNNRDQFIAGVDILSKSYDDVNLTVSFTTLSNQFFAICNHP